jgi:hypothetical protein
MAVFGSRVWFRFTCCLVLTVLPVSVGLSQTSGSDTPEFTNVVIPAGGDPYAVAVADVNHDGSMDIIARIQSMAPCLFCWVTGGGTSATPPVHLFPPDICRATSRSETSMATVTRIS